jgi:hypothetical protein
MPQIKALLKYIFGSPGEANASEDSIDYEQVVHLDAEDLAEQGIKAAYAGLMPALLHYARAPIEISEEINADAGSYAVVANGTRHEIWGPALNSEDGWARATVTFFDIVNANLGQSPVKFYALYGGNDLSGAFLTSEQYALARKSIKNPSHWPYIPAMEPPHYGFPAESAA